MNRHEPPLRRSISRPRQPGLGLAIGAAAATALGAAALVNVAGARRVERTHPPRGRFVEVEGTRLHYLERGAGPALVLLHGNGATLDDFVLSGLFDLAARHYRVIAFDRPGYGHSERPRLKVWTPVAQGELIHRALEQLGVTHPTILGHSWGTLVALSMALDQPENVRGLVLMSGYYFPTARLDAAIFAPPAIPVIGDLMRYTVSPLIVRLIAPPLIRRLFEPKPVPPRFARGFPLELALRPAQIRASSEESALMPGSAATLQARYGELRLPVAIVTGDEDRVVAFEDQSVDLHERVRQSTLRVLPGLGHMIHHFAQTEIMEAVAEVSSRPAERSVRGAAAAE